MDVFTTNTSLLEIVRNDKDLYEGDLIHYFQIVFRHAQNLSKPYHNFRHMMHVLFLCYQACIFYAPELTPRQMRDLLIAAIFHDFDHPGMSGNDDLNIARAIRGMEKHLLPEDWSYLSAIAGLIGATQYPHKAGTERLGLAALIIRDADLAQNLSSAWIQEVVFGLAAEWNKTPMEILTEQETFMRGITFQTDWAKAMFPQQIIDKKIVEVRGLIKILNQKLPR